MSYQPGVPTGTVPLNQDYLNLQGNFTALNNSWNQDHSPLTAQLPPTGTSGYHIPIHMVPFSTTSSNPPNNYPPTTPTATAGYGQLWSAQVNDGVNTDQSLFFLTGGNRNLQLTMNFTPNTTNNSGKNGYTFLPGGIIFQWGKVSSPSSGNNAVLFATNNIAFPNNCFSVQITLERASANVNGIVINSNSISKTGFTAVLPTAGSTAFYWWALGN